MMTFDVRALLLSRALFVVPLVAACGGDEPQIESSVDGVTRSRHGDTTIIVTSRDGTWGPPHDAIEVLRVGGNTRETTLGRAYSLAATPDGGVLLVDSKSLDGVVIRQFNANGEFVRNIGRHGGGPGEYNQPDQLIIAVHSNGTILVRDGGRVVNRYAADGKFIGGFSLGQRNGSTLELVPATDGSIYTRAPFPRGGIELPADVPAMLHYDSLGTLRDSIVERGVWLVSSEPRGRFSPIQAWMMLRDGRILYGRSDKLGFLLLDRARREPPLIAERAAEPVAFLSEERAELQAVQEMMQRNGGALTADVPETKLAMRGLVIDIDGRVWFYRSTTAQKVAPRLGGVANNQRMNVTYAEPPLLAAFQTDGTFLGEVRFPIGTMPTFVGDFAWAILPDEDDGPVLVKYRLR
jgi:hypothetical protein